MEIRDWRLLLLPEDGDSVVLSREKARELLERLERLEKEKAELLQKFEAYRKRHPETVGVKFGKVYALKTPTEPRPSGGKPGARPGHLPRLRPRPDHIDRQVHLPLTHCPECGNGQLSRVQETRTRVVEDLPAPRTEVTEYTVERRYCRTCRKLVESSVPGVLPHAQLGLRLMHAIVQLKVRHRVTVEQIPPLLRSLYGVAVSEGEVHAVLEQMATAYGPVYERFREAMREIKEGRRRTRSGRPPGRPVRATPEKVSAIVRLKAQGLTWKVIAQRVGLPRGTCANVASRVRRGLLENSLDTKGSDRPSTDPAPT